MTMTVLTPAHPDYIGFLNRLGQTNGLKGCGGSNSQARRLLTEMEGIDVEKTMEWLFERGGHCDCEIMLNCSRPMSPVEVLKFEEGFGTLPSKAHDQLEFEWRRWDGWTKGFP